VRAVPISDRIGLEGAPTIHYMSPEGKYLGSENKSSRALILPSDAETLQKIWSNNADLTKPKVPEMPPGVGAARAPTRRPETGSPPNIKVTPPGPNGR
jgi:hypothetical protein